MSVSGKTVNNLTLFSRPWCNMGIISLSSSGRGQTAPSNRIACLVASLETAEGLNTLPGIILQHSDTNTQCEGFKYDFIETNIPPNKMYQGFPTH